MWTQAELLHTWCAAQRRHLSFVLGCAIVLLMSIAIGLGLLRAIDTPAGLDTGDAFALALAALLALACGATGLLLARERALHQALRSASARIEDLSDQNWDLANRLE